MDTKLEGLTEYSYNTFVIAARSAGTAANTLSGDVSIAGRFTVIGDDGTSAAGGDVRPTSLPDTGESAPISTRERIGKTITIMAGAGGLAFFFLRYMRSRRSVDDQGTV